MKKNFIANMGMENAITIDLSENRKNPHKYESFLNTFSNNKNESKIDQSLDNKKQSDVYNRDNI